MAKTTFYKAAIVALIVLNCGTLAFMWFAPPRKPPMPPNGGPNGHNPVVAILMRELQFDEAQKNAYEIMLAEHRKQRKQLDTDVNEQQERLYKGLATGDTSAIAAVKELKGAIEMANFQHLTQLRGLCTPTQQAKFDKLIIETLRKANPNPPPPK